MITRDGQAVVELTPVRRGIGPITEADLDWLDRNRLARRPGGPAAAAFVRQMRDDDEA